MQPLTIDAERLWIKDQTARPIQILPEGEPIRELLGRG